MASSRKEKEYLLLTDLVSDIKKLPNRKLNCHFCGFNSLMCKLKNLSKYQNIPKIKLKGSTLYIVSDEICGAI